MGRGARLQLDAGRDTFCNAARSPRPYAGPVSFQKQQTSQWEAPLASQGAPGHDPSAPCARRATEKGALLAADLSEYFTRRKHGRGRMYLPPGPGEGRPA